LSGLTIQGLTKAFGGSLAVKGIDLNVAEGEFVSLLGPSGCGKTTTLRCVAGLDDPTGGRILFGDRDVTRVPTRYRMIGMVFQNYALFPHMTVAENIGFGLEMRSIRGQEAVRRIAVMVETVQLTGLEQRYPRELSGGQQQRVALARALVVEPALLLLDEPLANLDARLRDEMRFFIRSLQQRVGITTLYVTHDQSESMVMSDRIVVMFGGRIHQIGGPEDIYYRPASREAASFIGQANLIEGSVIAAEDGVALIEGAAGRFRCGTGTVVTAGEKVTAMVRPEALQMCDSADQADFHGRIVTTHFLGNVMEYRIALADGNVVSMQAMGGVAHGIDSPVSLRVDQNKAWLLR
jgi:putative spermidine/putrescine transport system ATP-binding protein